MCHHYILDAKNMLIKMNYTIVHFQEAAKRRLLKNNDSKKLPENSSMSFCIDLLVSKIRSVSAKSLISN